jgi:hypothetical protein
LAARQLEPEEYRRFEEQISLLEKLVKARTWNVDPDPHDMWVFDDPPIPPKRGGKR